MTTTAMYVVAWLAGVGLGCLILRSRWYRAFNARLRFGRFRG